MTLLRLSSLDRSSLGLSKRSTLLSSNTIPSNVDELHPSLTSVRTLPSVEFLDNADFLNMFGKVSDELPREGTRSILATKDRGLPPELSATPTTSKFPELHGNPTHRSELAPPPMSSTQPSDQSQAQNAQITYRSSVSSSIPSTKKSNASSRISRRSSVSSVTEDMSSSERSSKDSDRENALHERLKRRSREKRVSFVRTKASYSASSQLSQGGYSSSVHTSSAAQDTSARPLSRGKRLGDAMAEGVPVSPKYQATFKERPSTSPPENAQSNPITPPRRASNRLSRVLRVPTIDNYDRIRVEIMSNLDSLRDLQACAQVSRDFYHAFRKYESLLVDSVLFKQSSAAWELRYSIRQLESSPFRLKSVLRDYATIYTLEDFIIWRCQSILRQQSLAAFLGEDATRKAELEDAMWMTWSFCTTFGKTSLSDATLVKQIQWLNGQHTESQAGGSQFKRGPCTKQHLEDMSEIWRCLETLLSGFNGREEEARQAGVFDNAAKSRMTDKELLAAWVHDILSLGPKAVLTLSSCDFDQARVLGITKWKPPSKGTNRANFLKAAVGEVYRDRLVQEARQKALDYRKSIKIQHQHRRSSSDPTISPAKEAPRSFLPRGIAHSLHVDTKRSFRQSMPLQSVLGSQSQVELRPDCDPLSPTFTSPVLSPSSNPTAFQPLSMTKNVSTRLGPTLFPMQNRDQSHRLSIAARTPGVQSGFNHTINDTVSDPTDKAVALMVKEMGFSEREAKRALALSDTGAGIDVEAAIDILSADSTVPRRKRQSQICELPASVDGAHLASSAWSNGLEICEGHCKPMLLVEPRRERVSGLGMVKRGLSYRMSFRKSTKLSMIPDAEETSSPPRTGNTGAAKRPDSTLNHLATSTISAFTTPALSLPLNTSSSNLKETLSTVQEQSPVSPVMPSTPPWLKPDSNPAAGATMTREENTPAVLPTKPRITLQRVGTGVKRTGWNIPGMKKKEHITEPEIIGYAY